MSVTAQPTIETEGQDDDLVLTEPVDARWILRRGAPRLVRDGLGPLVVFVVVWKLVGTVPGILAATGFATFIFRHERRAGRPANVVRFSLALVFIRAAVGLISGSAKTYLGQEVIVDTILGLAMLGSLAAGRPLAEAFGRDVYPFPQQVRDSETYRRTFRTLSAVWGAYFLARAVVRLIAFLTLSVDQYVIVLAVSDVPFLISLLVWSVLFTVRRFRTSTEWGDALAIAEATTAATPPAGS